MSPPLLGIHHGPDNSCVSGVFVRHLVGDERLLWVKQHLTGLQRLGIRDGGILGMLLSHAADESLLLLFETVQFLFQALDPIRHLLRSDLDLFVLDGDPVMEGQPRRRNNPQT